MVSNEEFNLLFQGTDVLSVLTHLKGGYMEACGKCLQKHMSEFIVIKRDMTNQILSTVLD